jgi:hypothetical protein
MLGPRNDGAPRNHRLLLMYLVSITALGALLRAYHLGSKPLWFDESVVFWISQRTLPDLIAHNALENSAPPLFALLTSLVSRLSTTETALRFIPWLAGTLTVPTMYVFARRYLSEGAALVSALLIAVAPTQIQYSQQVREYSLSVLVGLLILGGVSVLLENNTWKVAGCLAFVAVVGIFTQYGLGLVVLAANILFLSQLARVKGESRRDLLIKWTVIQLIAVVSALAVYFLGLDQQMQPGGFASNGHLSSAYWAGASLRSAVEFVYGGARDLIAFTFPGYVFTLMLYSGTLILVAVHLRSPYASVITIPFVVVVAAALLRLYPLVGGRQDIFLTPLIFMVAATTIDYLLQIDRRRLLVGLFLALMVWRSLPSLSSYFRSDGEDGVGRLVERLATMAAPGDPVYVCLGGDPTVRYYFSERYPMPQNPLIEGIRGPGARDYIDQVDRMLERYGRAWMLTFASCGDMRPLIDHVSQAWTVELIEKRYPEAQLFFVH